ncbi:MAG: alanine racemase, partial [Firmicutes bacterium]|nr:alanine racemase [Bacillota bacterium]
MKWNELPSPAHLLDLDILQQNLIVYQAACDAEGKQLWPMMKTHKSLEIAKMQEKAGAQGILCGTIDECVLLWENGFQNIMYAYPPADPKNIETLLQIAKDCRMILRFDSLEAAALVDQAAADAGLRIDYTIIVDIGFHRFGVLPNEVGIFAREMQQFDNLRFCGIST